MTKITILGAGVTGMTIASQLPKDCEITIVGQHLPGDAPSKDWASPWAAAVWLGTHDTNEYEQKLQLDGLAGLRQLAERHPESSVRKIRMREIMDTGSPDQVWYQGKVPGFRWLSKGEMPEASKYGMTYETVVITPPVFLPWMRDRLEQRGVQFKRVCVGSLKELEGLGHDILINAAGLGVRTLADVKDSKVQPVRLQSAIFKHPTYREGYVRRGDNYYTTAFSHLDGEVYVGGVIEPGSDDVNAYDDKRQMILDRAHENQPDVFPSTDLKKAGFVRDHASWYPARFRKDGGVRVEAETVGGQKVIHAYGQHAGGYTFSYGIAWEVARIVQSTIADTRSLQARL
ncbi:unnamed protein product [Clonostachys solani]|uniref:FAD dependent oxidoreductase domain-containing protein n=1 Tax=Clonostachys solani TaxID=160281 RepID=A0A9N9YZF8_9HYPO|nr:unnamed protein product [Clonostachys solani]